MGLSPYVRAQLIRRHDRAPVVGSSRAGPKREYVLAKILGTLTRSDRGSIDVLWMDDMWKSGLPDIDADIQTCSGPSGEKKRKLPASFTTNCKEGAGAAPHKGRELQVPSFKFKGRSTYAFTAVEVDFLCNRVLTSGIPAIGFDIEWRVTFQKGQVPRRTALMQVCYGGSDCATPLTCLLLHVAHSGITPSLRDLLTSEVLIKAGVGIYQDAQKVRRDYGVECGGLCCLSEEANRRLERDPQTWSLAGLTREVLGKQLRKDMAIRVSDWETLPLSTAQQSYAADDAAASLLCYQAASKTQEDLPDAMTLSPKETLETLCFPNALMAVPIRQMPVGAPLLPDTSAMLDENTPPLHMPALPVVARLQPAKMTVLQLFSEGSSIESIATVRHVRPDTVQGYLADAMIAGYAYDWHRCGVSTPVLSEVAAAARSLLCAAQAEVPPATETAQGAAHVPNSPTHVPNNSPTHVPHSPMCAPGESQAASGRPLTYPPVAAHQCTTDMALSREQLLESPLRPLHLPPSGVSRTEQLLPPREAGGLRSRACTQVLEQGAPAEASSWSNACTVPQQSVECTNADAKGSKGLSRQTQDLHSVAATSARPRVAPSGVYKIFAAPCVPESFPSHPTFLTTGLRQPLVEQGSKVWNPPLGNCMHTFEGSLHLVSNFRTLHTSHLGHTCPAPAEALPLFSAQPRGNVPPCPRGLPSSWLSRQPPGSHALESRRGLAAPANPGSQALGSGHGLPGQANPPGSQALGAGHNLHGPAKRPGPRDALSSAHGLPGSVKPGECRGAAVCASDNGEPDVCAWGEALAASGWGEEDLLAPDTEYQPVGMRQAAMVMGRPLGEDVPPRSHAEDAGTAQLLLIPAMHAAVSMQKSQGECVPPGLHAGGLETAQVPITQDSHAAVLMGKQVVEEAPDGLQTGGSGPSQVLLTHGWPKGDTLSLLERGELKALKEKVSESLTYGEIRLCVAHIHRLRLMAAT